MKADGHFARDVAARYLGVSRATFIGTWPTKPRSPRRGHRPRCFTPGGGIDRPAHPRRGCRPTCAPPAGVTTDCAPPAGATTTQAVSHPALKALHDFKIRQLPLVPTCQWVKGDSIS